jgi:hypothetical protein
MQLNVEMDSLAKKHRAHIEDERRPTFGLPSTLDWSLWRGDHRITSWSDTDALRLIYEVPSRQFWKKKLRMPTHAQEPQWTSTYNTFKNTPTSGSTTACQLAPNSYNGSVPPTSSAPVADDPNPVVAMYYTARTPKPGLFGPNPY